MNSSSHLVGGLTIAVFGIHVNIPRPLVNLAGHAIIAVMTRVLAGGAGFLLTNFRKPTK